MGKEDPTLFARRATTKRNYLYNSCYTDGSIDELRITAEFLSNDWIEFEYANINAADHLLTFGTVEVHDDDNIYGTYMETTYEYDVLGRQNMTKTPDGTITRTVFDYLDNPIQTWVGTNDDGAKDFDPSNGKLAPNNMVKVSSSDYGSGGCTGCGGGSSLLVSSKQHVDDDLDNDRDIYYLYDWRERLVYTVSPDDTYTMNHYDNLDRVVKTERYLNLDSDSTGNDAESADDDDQLMARTEKFYDDRGRIYKVKVYEVNKDNGQIGNAMESHTWYDVAGNPIKQIGMGQRYFTKTTYDGLGQITATYVGYDADEEDYSEMDDVDYDTIFEQSVNLYDANGNLIQSTQYKRNPVASGTGALTSSATRVSTAGSWHDGIGRQVATANYGTGTLDRTTQQTIPSCTDSVLVTLTEYDSYGRAYSVTDPMGRVSLTEFDSLSRTVKVIENYVDLDDSDHNSSLTDQNVTVRTAYNEFGQVHSLTAENSVTGDQVTTYIYGNDKIEDSPAIYHNGLLAAVIYPDADDTESLDSGSDDIDDRVEYVYNRQSELTKMTDQNGTVHEYTYDALGRQTSDCATTLATNIDDTVVRIDHTYNQRGQLAKITSYSDTDGNPTHIVNETEHVYNNLGQLIADYQEHDSKAVDQNTSKKVQYAYDDANDGNGLFTKSMRPDYIEYPSGRKIHYNYNNAGLLWDRFNLPFALMNTSASNAFALYSYYGASTHAKTSYPLVTLCLDYTASNVLDAFGRVTNQVWCNYSNSTNKVEIYHGYDRNSNRLYRENGYSSGLHLDELYAYDSVNRLTNLQRGNLNAAYDGIVSGTLAAEERWTLDETGNWTSYQNDTDGDHSDSSGDWEFDAARTHNKANEITADNICWVNPSHDRNGNMKVMPKPNDGGDAYDVMYDAWNRIIQVRQYDGMTIFAQYEYDGRNFMTKRKTSTETRHFYYTNNWQCIEEIATTYEDSSSDSDVTEIVKRTEYVWGLRYIDDLILRDRDTTGNGELDERLYALQDANWNVVTLVDTSGNDVEHYTYDAYGQVTFRDMTHYPLTASDYDWQYTYTTRRLDPTTALMHYRHRWYTPWLGRFVNRDPIGYEAGDTNLYSYVYSDPLGYVDPWGLSGTTSSEELERAVALAKLLVKAAKKLFPSLPGDKIANEMEKALNESYNEAMGDPEGYYKETAEWLGIDAVGAQNRKLVEAAMADMVRAGWETPTDLAGNKVGDCNPIAKGYKPRGNAAVNTGYGGGSKVAKQTHKLLTHKTTIPAKKLFVQAAQKGAAITGAIGTEVIVSTVNQLAEFDINKPCGQWYVDTEKALRLARDSDPSIRCKAKCGPINIGRNYRRCSEALQGAGGYLYGDFEDLAVRLMEGCRKEKER